MQFRERYEELKSKVHQRLAELPFPASPASIYEPASYVLAGGGKAIRPVLVMLGCEAVGGRPEDALDAAVAVEILHNFTLVHDDIMDNADQRRGRATVHKKWDTNVAILVGDALIGVSYELLLNTMPKGNPRELIHAFTRGIIDVCEGQAFDKEYESAVRISDDEYFMMIAKKTGRLVTMSLEMGAIIGAGGDAERLALRMYGESVGRAFQVQDDLLDVIADEKEFGKTIGGDILEGKKTYLLTHAMAKADGADMVVLDSIARKTGVTKELIPVVTEIYQRLGVLDDAREHIRRDTDRAITALQDLPNREAQAMLTWFAEMLLPEKFLGMVELEVTIRNRAGVHTRPAAAIVKTAARFKSNFIIEKDGYEINGKSIIGVMTLAAECGSKVVLRFEGGDEDEAMQEMVTLFENGFGEL